ncbi:MAG: TrbC/VirB2 family protein [Patescibacteria group bacterium]|nr:pilin [Patescibacteria group bacterium]
MKNKFILNLAGISLTLSFIFTAAGILIPQSLPAQAESVKIDNPLGEESQDFNFEEVATKIIDYLKTIVAFVAIAVLIIAGIFYVFSQGNEQRTTLAKKIMTGAVIGVVIVLAAPTILKELFEIFGFASKDATIDAAQEAKSVVTKAAKTLLSVLGAIGIISLVWSGILYLTSGGNQERAEKAKKQFVYSVIGLVIALAALIIIKQIDELLTEGATGMINNLILI